MALVHTHKHTPFAVNHSLIFLRLPATERIKCHFMMKVHLLAENMTCTGLCLPCISNNHILNRVDKRRKIQAKKETQKLHATHANHMMRNV